MPSSASSFRPYLHCGRPVGPLFWKKVVETILPASITGPVAMIIGLTLAGNALGDAIPSTTEVSSETTVWIIVALVTLISTILYSRYLKGFLGQLPLLLGVLTGCAVAGIAYAAGWANLFRAVPAAALEASAWRLGDGSILRFRRFPSPRFLGAR